MLDEETKDAFVEEKIGLNTLTVPHNQAESMNLVSSSYSANNINNEAMIIHDLNEGSFDVVTNYLQDLKRHNDRT
jgi:hypothetical protein